MTKIVSPIKHFLAKIVSHIKHFLTKIVSHIKRFLCFQHKVEYTKAGDILVDKKYTIEIGGKSKDGKQIANIHDSYIAADNIEYPSGNKIPLWAFGFIY